MRSDLGTGGAAIRTSSTGVGSGVGRLVSMAAMFKLTELGLCGRGDMSIDMSGPGEEVGSGGVVR